MDSTNTSRFQLNPDYYRTSDELIREIPVQTNPRYTNFKQKHFTAGDLDQFEQFRQASFVNPCLCIPSVSETNIYDSDTSDMFANIDKMFQDISGEDVSNTFRYIFFKFKKGIFIKVVDNKLVVFLPFSNAQYVNEASDKLKVDTSKFKDIVNFQEYINSLLNIEDNIKKIASNPGSWICDGCIVNYDYGLEADNNVSIIKNMFETLCKTRNVPDIELFINKRDFPLLTKSRTEPYFHIWGTRDQQLVSHKYDKYCPILSMSKTDEFADILFPTWDDWSRVQYEESGIFFDTHSGKDRISKFTRNWSSKNSLVIFRGSSTGCGTKPDTNMRLKLVTISKQHPLLLDAGITNWDVKPRKSENSYYIETFDKTLIDSIGTVPYMSSMEQSRYKYVICIDGYVSAYRLSTQLAMGSVVLLVSSKWKVWYSNLLVPYVHYIPIKEDLSDLIDQINWCIQNDDKSSSIANNAIVFYEKYLTKNGQLDYLEQLLYNLYKHSGQYVYNVSTLDTIYRQEKYYSITRYEFPNNLKYIRSDGIPFLSRTYGCLKAFEWYFNNRYTYDKLREAFRNGIDYKKDGVVSIFKASIFNMNCVIKRTNNQHRIADYIHETYVGLNCINNLSKIVPNFLYTYISYKERSDFISIHEHIGTDQTLDQYLRSHAFNTQEFILILTQILLALYVAQQEYGFNHNNLHPRHVLLQRLSSPINIDYPINPVKVYSVKTSIIPIVIDYRNSRVVSDMVVYNNSRIHTTMNMYRDFVNILFTSVQTITQYQKILPVNLKIIHDVCNHFAKDLFKREPFDQASLSQFLTTRIKDDTLMFREYGSFVDKSLIDFVQFLSTRKLTSSFMSETQQLVANIDIHNPTQIYDLYFIDMYDSFIKLFENVLSCGTKLIKKNTNLFATRHSLQTVDNLLIVSLLTLNSFAKTRTNGVLPDEIILRTGKIRNMLDDVYKSLYSDEKWLGVIPDIPVKNTEYKQFMTDSYTSDIYYNPNHIVSFLETHIHMLSDKHIHAEKSIIISVLQNNGVYKLTSKERSYVLSKYDRVLKCRTHVLLNNVSIVNTLSVMSKKIYTMNILKLGSSCGSSQNILDMYSKILNHFV